MTYVELNDIDEIEVETASIEQLEMACVYLTNKIAAIDMQLSEYGKEHKEWYNAAAFAVLKTREQLRYVKLRIKQINRQRSEESAAKKHVRDYLINELRNRISEEEFNTLLDEANGRYN